MQLKSTLVFICCCLMMLTKTNAQAPAIQWQKCLGGSDYDYATGVQQTTDSGYIISGSAQSHDGMVTNNHGHRDCWIVKLDKLGNLEWQKTYGGSGYDEAYSIEQTNDGGYIVAGFSDSNDGDVSGNHGDYDVWVFKISSAGNLEWQKTYGGTGLDYAYSIQQTFEGGYVLAGETYSTNGDVTGNHGSNDFWIVKLSNTGVLEWQKTLGGTGSDVANSIYQAKDSGYIISGITDSQDGDITNNHGGTDCWVVKLDKQGSLVWQKTLGGTDSEDAYSVQQTTDSGYIVAGLTFSSNGDVSNNYGSDDYWVVKLDINGALLWQKNFGGTQSDYALSIEQTRDSGYIVGGYSNSTNGDITNNRGGGDGWIAKLNNAGNLQWQRTIGGSFDDEANFIKQTLDGGYIVACNTYSIDGDVTNNNGFNDYWIVKLAPPLLPLHLLSFTAELLSPSPLERVGVRLNWKTENEINVSHFNIQRSVNGKEFNSIGKVAANNKPDEYRFTDDRLPLTADREVMTVYYRLEIVDRDGSKSYSTIRVIKNKAQSSDITIHINSVHDNLVTEIISDKNEKVSVQILDYRGKLLQHQELQLQAGSNRFSFNTASLAKGIYLFVVQGAAKQVRRFVKQ